jgi:hypothetical protein
MPLLPACDLANGMTATKLESAMRVPGDLLARIVNRVFNPARAVGVPGFSWRRSILGDPGSLVAAQPGLETELAAFRPFWSREALGTLLRVAPSYPVVRRWVREPCEPIRFPGNCTGKHRDERWFYINGICTDRRLAELGAATLCRIFDRPFTILYSPTEGFIFDLLASVIGKGWTITESATCNFAALVEALLDPEVRRVIVISHSQGAIVAGVMLKALEELLPLQRPDRGAGVDPVSPERRVAREIVANNGTTRRSNGAKVAIENALKLSPSDIGKLELYCFANCATSMESFVVLGTPPQHAPWIESYGNEYDMVARLGVLAPPYGVGSARIGGDRYRRSRMWGHLFNAHYLLPMVNDLTGATPPSHELEPFHSNLRQRPRLWEYVDGNTPPSFP